MSEQPAQASPAPESPSPPVVSPDGRFFLRDGQWVPMGQPAPSGPAPRLWDNAAPATVPAPRPWYRSTFGLWLIVCLIFFGGCGGILASEGQGGAWGGLGEFLIALTVYLLPTLVSAHRRQRRAGTVAVINLLLGWTAIGWIVALAMAAGTEKV